MKILNALLKSTAAAAVLAFGFAETPFAAAQVSKPGRPSEPASTPAPPVAPVRPGSPSIRDLKSNSIGSGPKRPGAAEIKVAKFVHAIRRLSVR